MDNITINELLAILIALNCEAINLDALSAITGWSRSTIYKMTSAGRLPYYKPNGKTIFFKKEEIEKYLLQNRQDTKVEIEAEAIDIVHLSNDLI